MESKTNIQVLIEEEAKNIIEYKGHTFFILQPNSGKSMEELASYSGILIQATHTAFCNFTIQRLRGHFNPKIHLKPIYFLRPSNDSGKYISSLIDGSIFDINQLETIIPNLEEIILKNEKVNPIQPVSYEAQLIVKTLSFAYTRSKKKIEPVPYVFSSINFSYPGLSPNFEHLEEFKVFEVMDLAEDEGLVKSEFHDKTHLCSKCNHGSLNYRSVCPKCSYTDSETQEIIHHFPCGFVGPINDFRNDLDDSLNCPKCNKTLRHIGVDYDKPSILHFCKRCDHKFQDFEVKAKCLACDFDNELESLIEKNIKAYHITNKGENVTQFGYLGTAREIEEIIGTVKYEFFQLMTKYEVERIRQTEGKSNIGMIYIGQAGELYSRIGKEAQQQLFKDIVQEVRNSIRSSDIISFKDASTLILSLNDIPIKIANRILDEIVILLEKLIKNNFNEIEVDFITKCTPLNFEENYKLQIQNLVNKFD